MPIKPLRRRLVARRWCQQRDRNRRQAGYFDDGRPQPAPGQPARGSARRRDAVADLDRDDRAGNGLAVRGGPDHLAVLRTAVHRIGLVGDLESGVLETLARPVDVQPGYARHPRAGTTIDVPGIGGRQVEVPQFVAIGFIAVNQVRAGSLPP